MATAGEERPAGETSCPTGPLSEAILSAIAESRMSHYEIGMKSGVDNSLLSAFVRGEVGLGPSSVDKLCDFFGLKVVPGSEAAPDDPSQTASDALRLAIDARGLSYRGIAGLFDVSPETINRFLRRDGGLRLSTADVACNVLGLKVVRIEAARSPGSSPDTVNPARPIGDALLRTFAERGLDERSLPKATGLHRETIRRFYDPSGDISLETVEGLCDFFGLGAVRKESGPGDPPQTVSDAIRSAIEECGLSRHALARANHLNERAIGRFLSRKGGLRLSTAESLCDYFGIRLVHIAAAGPVRGARPKPPAGDASRRAISDALRRAISDRGLDEAAIVGLSDLSPTTIYFFRKGDRILNYNSLLKLADGLKVDVSPFLERPTGGPISPEPSRRCPVELGGGGLGPRVYGVDVPKLTPDEHAITALLVKAFEAGGEGYTRKELKKATGARAPWRTVANMRGKPGYEPWREVLPDRTDARKGERFGLIDPRGGRW